MRMARVLAAWRAASLLCLALASPIGPLAVQEITEFEAKVSERPRRAAIRTSITR